MIFFPIFDFSFFLGNKNRRVFRRFTTFSLTPYGVFGLFLRISWAVIIRGAFFFGKTGFFGATFSRGNFGGDIGSGEGRVKSGE